MAPDQRFKQVFDDKECTVLVLHPTSSIRGQISNSLKEAGFKTVAPAESIQDAVAILSDALGAKTLPGWILTPLFLGEKSNALQLGQLLASTPELAGVFWSAIATPEDMFGLPLAIESGLLSWHPAESFAQVDAIKNEINGLLSIAGRLEFHQDIVSLSYARNYLRASDSYDALLRVTATLVELKPDLSEFLMHYADALALNQDIPNARKFATRAVWADRSLITRLQEIRARDRTPVFTDDEIKALGATSDSLVTAFGITRCVVVEPDTAVRNHLKKALNDLGVSEVVEFEDGQSAWDFIKDNARNTIVISEWKLPKLSGMALLQRIHQHGFEDTPVIISSAQLGPQDKGLLEELGSAVLLQKPLSLDALEVNIRLAVKEENLPSSFKGIMRKVRSSLRNGDVEEGKEIWRAASNKMLIPGIPRKIMAAEILFAEAKIEEAWREAQDAADQGAKGAYFYGLLGKISFALGDFDASAEWLEKANREVPINLERLTSIAEVELHRGELDKASEVAASAAAIDAQNPKVIETQAMVALEKGNQQEAKALMSQLNDLMNVVAHLNNRAVTMAWKGEHDKGIELYREALASAPPSTGEGQSSFAPFVTYNLALALARKGDLKGAREAIAGLNKAEVEALGERLLAKIGGFEKRVNEAIKTGAKLEIETPRTTDITRKRILKIRKQSPATAGHLAKSLKLMGAIDYRALKLVEKKLRLRSNKG